MRKNTSNELELEALKQVNKIAQADNNIFKIINTISYESV
jgi:hypothetical protein